MGDEYIKESARLNPRSREEARRRDTVFDLVERVHEVESALLKTPPEPAHKFTVTLESNAFTEEKYLVFENYQRLVHHEAPSRISREGFRRFLCDSPIRRETMTGPDGRRRELGSFHQCYRLDGKLVAIGVLDLLPESVSAVYFLYHESIHRHGPGKLGALREIALALEEGYRWWYPGYYIHSCPKMRYKIDYSPQYVLDPENLTWHLLDKKFLDLFDQKHYVSPSRDARKERQAKERAELIAKGETLVPDCDSEEDEEDSFLLMSNFPGISTLSDLDKTNLDDIRLRIDGHMYYTKDLTTWPTSKTTDWRSVKGQVAELVAAIGHDLVGELCLDFPRQQSNDEGDYSGDE